MFVKFCGFTRERDVEAAADLGVSAVGFIFHPASKRCVTPERAALLGKITQAAITAFGVVVALQEIGIAAEFIGNVFIVVLSAFCFGLALAFALGSKDIVKKWLEEVTQKKP